MSSRVHDVREAIITGLATMTTGGGYAYNYNATDQVKAGIVPEFLAPLPLIRFLPQESVSTDFGYNAGSQVSILTLDFVGVWPVTAATTDSGLDAAEAGLEDLEVWCRANMHLAVNPPVLCHKMRVARADITGGLVEGTGEAGVVQGQIEVEFTVQRG